MCREAKASGKTGERCRIAACSDAGAMPRSSNGADGRLEAPQVADADHRIDGQAGPSRFPDGGRAPADARAPRGRGSSAKARLQADRVDACRAASTDFGADNQGCWA